MLENYNRYSTPLVIGQSYLTFPAPWQSLRIKDPKTPSVLLKENLFPGEKVVLRLDGMCHISRGRAELGTLFITNYHLIYNPQFVYEGGSVWETVSL